MSSSITIDTSALGISWALNTTYRVAVTEGFVTQNSGLYLPVAGNANITTFQTPSTAPQLITTSPIDNDTLAMVNDKLKVSLSRDNLVAGTGNVNLYYANATIINTFPISSLTLNGGNIIIPVGRTLGPNLSYYVTTDANIVQDTDGYNYAGISSNTEFNWTTSPNWNAELSPSGNTSVYDTSTLTTITDSPYVVAGISGTYKVNVNATISNTVSSISSSGTLGGTSTWSSNILQITGNTEQVNSHLNNTTIMPVLGSTANIILNYTLTTPSLVTYSSSMLIDHLDNSPQNLSVSRGYNKNRVSELFLYNPIQLVNGLPSDNYEVRFEITNGGFGAPGQGLYGNVNFVPSDLTLIGSMSSINEIIPTIKYYPNYNNTSNLSIKYTQIKNSITQFDQVTIPLNYGGVISGLLAEYTILQPVYPTVPIISFTPDQLQYGNVNILLVGHGGRGGDASKSSSPSLDVVGGGGGGGGEVIVSLNTQGLQPFVEYSFQSVNNGGNISLDFAGLSARQGTRGGDIQSSNYNGGKSGRQLLGGTGASSPPGPGGGGGGESSVGYNGNFSTLVGGDGGEGVTIDISSLNNSLGISGIWPLGGGGGGGTGNDFPGPASFAHSSGSHGGGNGGARGSHGTSGASGTGGGGGGGGVGGGGTSDLSLPGQGGSGILYIAVVPK